MRWTTIGTALALALAAFFLADRWGYSAAEAILIPAVTYLLFIGMLLAIVAVASGSTADVAREFLKIIKHDLSALVRAIREKDK